MKLKILAENFAICKLKNMDALDKLDETLIYSLTVTPEEISLVCKEGFAPKDAEIEKGWRALKIIGPLDFGLVGVIAKISKILAKAKISIFVLSTFDTDYIFLKARDLKKAITALQNEEYQIESC